MRWVGAVSAVALLLCCGCASAPAFALATPKDPQRGCWFDNMRRFEAVNVIGSDQQSESAHLLVMTRRDTEIRSVPAAEVRMGKCPDEMQQIDAGRGGWGSGVIGSSGQPDTGPPRPPLH